MHLIKRADYQSMPWKNGLGSTTQIAIFPAAATTDDFDWRISMAVVKTDGPFSLFPGIERTLVVLEGAGIDLSVDAKQVERVELGSAPLTFAADVSTTARLIDGPILDLNIMARRDRFKQCVRRFGKPDELELTGTAVLFAWNCGLRIEVGAQSTRIEMGDAAILEYAKKLEITPESAGDYYLIELTDLTA